MEKHNMSKVKCFHCHEYGHIATNFPRKKKNKMAAGAAVGEALASQFELNFSLIACMVSSALGSGWYLYSGASFHKTGDKKIFSELVEKDLQMHMSWATMDNTMRLALVPLPFRGRQVNSFI